MPVSHRILPDIGLVVIRYWGHAGIAETESEYAKCITDPAFNPSLRHLIDLSGVESVEKDFARFFAMMAKLTETYGDAGGEQMAVYWAPHDIAVEMAMMAKNSWEAVPSVIIRIQSREADALAMLGLQARSIADLVDRVD